MINGTTIKPIALAVKCLVKWSFHVEGQEIVFANGHHLTMVYPFRISRMSQRSIKTAIPMVITVRIPLTFDPHVHAMKAPVMTSQVHHSGENSLFELEYEEGDKKRMHTSSEVCGIECKNIS
jgi:hypothetical protein